MVMRRPAMNGRINDNCGLSIENGADK